MLYIEDKVDVETHPILERKTVITLGNFDGIHLGHRQLLDQAIQIAKDRDLATLFLTFSPHSNSLIPSKPKPRLLYTLQQKIHLLEEYGNIDIFLNFCFDETLREMPAAQFFYDILLRRYQAAAIVVGDGFRFGCGGAGDTELLARYCHKEGVYFVKAPCLYWEGEPVSSTRIRRLIEHGRMPEAMKLLGRPYYLEGVVEKGKQLGGQETGAHSQHSLVLRPPIPAEWRLYLENPCGWQGVRQRNQSGEKSYNRRRRDAEGRDTHIGL